MLKYRKKVVKKACNLHTIKYIKLVIDKPISGAYNRQSVVSVMLIYYI